MPVRSRSSVWPSLLVAALALPACAPRAEVAPAPPPRTGEPAPTADAVEVDPAVTATSVVVRAPKRVPAALDCGAFVVPLSRATGVKAEVKAEESTAELCRFRLPYTRGATSASILFRAEPPGTPSFKPVGELFGNTAYQVGGAAGKDCGLSIVLDPVKPAHQHGSHLTVLGTYEGAESPCVITHRVTETVFDRLADA